MRDVYKWMLGNGRRGVEGTRREEEWKGKERRGEGRIVEVDRPDIMG